MSNLNEKLNMDDVCGQKSCFAYRDGHCDCLSDTDFNGRGCPFFKSMKQYEEDLKKTANMSKEPEDDFLLANADLIAELDAMEEEAKHIEAEGGTEEDISDDDGWDDVNESEGDDNADE